MQLFERIPHESARDYALRIIKYNIVNMNFLPKSKINDQQIAMELGISRTPVREALIELSKYGLVEMYPQKGSIIAPVSYRMIREAAVTREALECAAVARCCRIEDQSVLSNLTENLDLMKLYTERGEIDQSGEYDVAFHRELFRLAGMSTAHEFLTNLEIHYRRIISLAYDSGTNRARDYIFEHWEIFNAILTHDEEKATATMKKHLNQENLNKVRILEIYPDCIIDT